MEDEPRYYYTTLDDGRRAVTCLLIRTCLAESYVVARAVALCSLKDQFNKKLGREIACGRATKAARLREDRKYADFMPTLTALETRILESAKKAALKGEG